MDYLIENLGPERFQEVCHSLLCKAFPKTQCFPIAQRDGGRDAISFYYDQNADEFIVYQVKYVRKPHAEKDPHNWLKEILAEEIPKVKALIPKGAKEYYILTNVPGTAYPESGSIDTVQELLNKHLDIPAQCWWRDDINRRLDDAWNIKWAYPDILSGPDILRLIIEAGLTEDAQRRTSAIRAFLRDQYNRETEVRFKQVELQNKLLDLFVDVPIDLREHVTQRQMRAQEHVAIRRIEAEYNLRPHQESLIGAASFLLHSLSQQHISRVVIEGAPGQGKSTITQYICQIHRGRILNENNGDTRIPQAHLKNAVRLPFKIDCRDFSLWLARQNPFSGEAKDVPEDWQKSLESFLAAQITHHSGGVAFSVSDLHATTKLSAVLLVLDGLDEVADINRRRDVVDQINKGVNRLTEIAVSLQTIVTSRPAAFANSPGMPEETFRYFHLASITQPIIEEYAEKWLKARRLDGKDASEVRRILRDKLDQPHLKELARNPMQLAILLSLIQTRGGSLPDKRTALYDNYVELFFNRESEKSTIVRDHRDILIDIHRYLAWILHAESQTKQNRGSVTAERLRELVESYLKEEQHDSNLAQQLFTGMVERVVALVSRVEGTYEFEVQPLREYFAARHLYYTAPYSPAGHEQRGTLPDRFDALCRDFYWQNVTRFYAGCYSKGELPSLVDRIEVLSKTIGYKDTSHPQSLAATLLADWVFAQHPKSMKQVVALILSGIGMRCITSASRNYRGDAPLVLPKQSGNEELVDRCFELLNGNPPSDYADKLIDLILGNANLEDRIKRWLTPIDNIEGARKTRWIKFGLNLGVLSNLTHGQLDQLLDDTSEEPYRLQIFLRAGQHEFILANENRFRTIVEWSLTKNIDSRSRRVNSLVDAFLQTFNPYRYACSFQMRQPVPLHMLWEQVFRYADGTTSIPTFEIIPNVSISKDCNEIVKLGKDLSEISGEDWATKLSPWSQLVESARQRFGDCWSFNIVANAAAGIRSKQELCEDASDLHDKTVPLCRRVRYARLRAGVSSWWQSQLDKQHDSESLVFTLLILLTWGGQSVLEKCAVIIDQKLKELCVHSWTKLCDAIYGTPYGFGQDNREIAFDLTLLPTIPSERTVVALASRVNPKLSDQLFRLHLTTYMGDDLAVLEFCYRSALRAAQENSGSWHVWLPIIAKSYAKGAISDRYFGHRFTQVVKGNGLPPKIAEEIIQKCDTYPTELVAWAEQTCRERVAAGVTPVGKVAETQKWFRD